MRYDALLLILMLTSSCGEQSSKPKDASSEETTSRTIAPPEPDRELREASQTLAVLRALKCTFNNPDTSLVGIHINDTHSAKGLIGEKDSFLFGETYGYLSADGRELAFLTAHPGNSAFHISEFEVRRPAKSEANLKRSAFQVFKTESNIHLGIDREKVTKRFGNCFVNSTDGDLEVIHYRIEAPKDTRSGILQRHNLPFYFSDYYFRKGKLERFKFGFEYP
jgi:hypothetical protein